MIRVLAIAALLQGCAVADRFERDAANSPTVQIVTGTQDPGFLVGLAFWGPLGFRGSFERTSFRECSRSWFLDDGPADCQLTIRVTISDLGRKDTRSILGHADQAERSIVIDSNNLSPSGRPLVFAHELGHILLDAGHLPSDQDGVMSTYTSDFDRTALTTDDLEHACAAIGVCEVLP